MNSRRMISTGALMALGFALAYVNPANAAGCPAGDTCVEIKPGENIRVAPMFSKTGSGANAGTDDARGIYVAWQNRHQVRGRDIELVGYPGGGDDFTLENGITVPNWDDANAINRASTLLTNDKIVAVIGTTLSGAATVVNPIFSAAKYLIVSPQTQGALLTKPPRPEFYARTIPTGILQAEGLAESVCGAGLTFASVHDGNAAFTKTLAQSFSDKCTSLGGLDETPGGIAITNPPDYLNFNAALNTILANNGGTAPGFIYLSFTGAAANGTLVQWIRIRSEFSSTVLGQTNAALSDAMWQSANAAIPGPTPPAQGAQPRADGVLVSTYDFTFDVNINNPSVQRNRPLAQFYRQYDDIFGLLVPGRIPPTDTEFPPYVADAYNIVLDAIKKVALDHGGSLLIPRIALKDAVINGTTNVQGLTGILNCNNPSPGGAGPNYVGDCNPDIQTLVTRVQCSSATACAFVEVP